jgi:hypothetical protein
MSSDDRSREEAGRDIAAARAELRGRRDQLVAEYDERLKQLDSMAAAVDDGGLKPKVAQDRVRQLLRDRNGGMARAARAGRTQIGMRLPASAPGAGKVSVRSGPSSGQASAELDKVRAEVGRRLVSVMMLVDSSEARLELALLGQLWNSLSRHARDMPSDAVLIDSLLEYASEARSILDDLDAGGSGRLRRLLEYNRQLLSQIVALGGVVDGVKERIESARRQLGDNADLRSALQAATGSFERLWIELGKCAPRQGRTLFDDVFGQ